MDSPVHDTVKPFTAVLKIIAVLFILLLSFRVYAETYVSGRYSINSGGGSAASQSYKVNGSIGQTFASFASDTGYMHYIGLWSSEAPGIEAQTISDLKLLPDGVLAGVVGKVATSSQISHEDFFYIEDPNRQSGIRVSVPGEPLAGLIEGSVVNVFGVMDTTGAGERQLVGLLTSAVSTVSPLDPVAMNNAAVGGSDWFYNPVTGAGQKGVAGASGENNIGLLVRTTGKVIRAGPNWFLIDDGSIADGLDDPSRGVRVEVPAGVSLAPRNCYVVVTGLSSCYKTGPNLYRLILARRQEDITVIPDADLKTIGQAKSVQEGVAVTLKNKKVTAVFPGCFYMEETDRSSGIRVISSEEVNENDIVTVTGAMRTTVGEREIFAADVSASPQPNGIAPVGLPTRNLGGGTYWYQPGVRGARGVNNIGLLARVCGRVTAIYPDRFYIDDGSRKTADDGHVGVKVVTPDIVVPLGLYLDAYVSVVGVSSCYRLLDGSLESMIRTRRTSDMIVLRVVYLPIPINNLRLQPDNLSLTLSDGIVTAVFNGFFYLESQNRATGIRITSPTPVSEGDSPVIRGTLTTIDGERVIIATSVDEGSHGNDIPKPIGFLARNVGGADFGEIIPGVEGGRGANNIGLLACFLGKVAQIDPDGNYLYLNDGSRIKDGTQTEITPGVFEDNLGIKTVCDPSDYLQGDYLMITGVNSCFKDNQGKLRRQILVKSGGIQKIEM
ncbi:MAG: hypothetical protein Q7N50_15750 [Armatimonadota bacterium]|nr:hypothetical protein [Armatimonadota bacterium]